MHFMSLNHIKYNSTIFSLIYLEQSRRDDLESLMYNLLYLTKGRFPWFGDGGNRPSAKTEHIVQMKERLRPEDLFINMPSKFFPNLFL